jgi:eukaryotic-like serine/threonine-protein kinase
MRTNEDRVPIVASLALTLSVVALLVSFLAWRSVQPTSEVSPTPTVEPAVVIPDVTRMPVEEASQRLLSLGLQVGTIQHQFSTQAPGLVLVQSAGAGQALAPGTPVSLVVSAGPEPPKQP